jgi:hypothetical protein
MRADTGTTILDGKAGDEAESTLQRSARDHRIRASAASRMPPQRCVTAGADRAEEKP